LFERELDGGEVELVRRAEAFVRENHREEGGHDAAHVLAVTGYAIAIGEDVVEPADPFVVTLGALFHDLGRIGAETGILHGLRGASIAREWLHSTGVAGDVREQILRVVARHTPTTGIPPATVEERIVFDADALDRLGIIGMLRGFAGKRGSTEHIIEDRIQKRLGDYDRLHFDVSRRMGEDLHADTLDVVARFREALKHEVRELHRIPWPVSKGVGMPVPSLGAAATREEVPDLAGAMARVEPEAEIDRAHEGDGDEEDGQAFGGEGARKYRPLTPHQVALIETIARFVERNHADLRGHDYAHVLTVVKNSLRIAKSIGGRVNPFVLLCGAFFHDIGWVGSEHDGREHGLRGGSIANEYLSSTWLPEETIAQIRRVVVRHSLRSGMRPETVEERIVWDADGLAGIGLIGAARGIISGVGSMEEIIRACLRYSGKRAEDLYFDESRRLAEALHADSESLIRRFAAALEERRRQVERLRLPMAGAMTEPRARRTGS
jgi:HD superfamily phosphodiesterase